jgi:biopolymer transport protein ExbB/TolQ
MILAGLAVGLVTTMWGMVAAFNAANETGQVDQNAVSQAVTTSMTWTQIGLAVAAVGVVVWVASGRGKAKA